MRANFGLTSISSPQKLVIAVSLTNRPGYVPSYLRTVGQVSVPSPVLYLAPIELTDVQILAQSIVLPLLDQVIAEVTEQHGIESPWQPLLNGLRLWQLWGMALPLAGWREDVVKWLYADLSTADTRQPPILPDHYAEFCTAHKLWLVSPIQLGIPLLCADLDWEYQYVSSWYFLDLPIHLNQINPPPPQYDQSEEIRDRGRTVALATLIEYAVATYGSDRLPVLVAGLAQHDSWETLIPAVYGVSPAAFEAGWQAYLVAHYDISLETIMR